MLSNQSSLAFLNNLGLLILLSLTMSCSDQEPELHQRIHVINDENVLNERLWELGDTLQISLADLDAGRNKAPDFALVLQKSLESPQVNGQTLQATSVHFSGENVFVSYNYQGPTYYGGADLLNNGFKLKSQVLYDFADINDLVVDSDQVYLTGGVKDAHIPAQLLKIGYKNHQFIMEGAIEAALGSYAGTSIDMHEGHLYVTTGDDETNGGGLYQLDEDLNIINYLALNDARWVMAMEEWVVVAQGTPGRLTFVESTDFSVTNTITFEGADIPESKTTIDIADNRLFVAAGTAGVHVLSAEDGSLLHTLSFDDAAVTNAVTAEEGLLFIANGEGGLHVASYSEDVYAQPELVGEILFDNHESVNHVLNRDRILYVATGMGGVKQVSIVRK